MVMWSPLVSAGEYTTPSCYENVPTTCSFNEMTLALCNKEGKKTNSIFYLSKRIYTSGGNKFTNANGDKICIVKRIKNSEPKRYIVVIE